MIIETPADICINAAGFVLVWHVRDGDIGDYRGQAADWKTVYRLPSHRMNDKPLFIFGKKRYNIVDIINNMEAFMVIAEQIRKELRQLIREMGLLSHNCLNSGMTLAQAHVLSYLNQNGTTSFGDLQLQLGIDKASLSRILNTMKLNDYIMICQDASDKRAKNIDLLPQGRQKIEAADTEANQYIEDILRPYRHKAAELADSLKTIRLLALRDNIMKQCARIKFERLLPRNYDTAIRFVSEVFCLEQNIPAELIPVNNAHQPVWWCARVGEDIVATAVSWLENEQWHWGRFAVDKRLRGIGVGKQLAISSLLDTFNLGTDSVYIEARDISAILITGLGGKIIDRPRDFYGQPVTPIVLRKADFAGSLDSLNPNCIERDRH